MRFVMTMPDLPRRAGQHRRGLPWSREEDLRLLAHYDARCPLDPTYSWKKGSWVRPAADDLGRSICAVLARLQTLLVTQKYGGRP